VLSKVNAAQWSCIASDLKIAVNKTYNLTILGLSPEFDLCDGARDVRLVWV
jgi:hypothetical protein